MKTSPPTAPASSRHGSSSASSRSGASNDRPRGGTARNSASASSKRSSSSRRGLPSALHSLGEPLLGHVQLAGTPPPRWPADSPQHHQSAAAASASSQHKASPNERRVAFVNMRGARSGSLSRSSPMAARRPAADSFTATLLSHEERERAGSVRSANEVGADAAVHAVLRTQSPHMTGGDLLAEQAAARALKKENRAGWWHLTPEESGTVEEQGEWAEDATITLRQRLLKGGAIVDPILLAATYVKDGIHGRPLAHNIDVRSLKRYNLYHSGWYRTLYLLFGVVNLALGLVEPSAGRLQDQKLPLGVIFAIELICVAVFVFDCCLLLSFHGRGVLRANRWVQVKATTVVLLFIGSILAICVPSAPRLIRVIRPLVVFERMRNVRKISGSILKTLPKITLAAMLLVFHIFLFGLFAYVLFAGIDETRCDIRYQPTYEFCSVFSKNCTNYYSRIVDSMLHLFTLITTANYPDVMMPAYNCSQWNALFFILFLLIGLYFLMSLVLAVAYTHFQEQTKHKVVSLLRRRVAGLTLAFNVISQPKRRFLASAFPGAEPADHHNLVPPGAKTYRHVGPAGELAAEAGGGEGMPPPGAWRRRRSSSGAGRDPMSRSSRQKLLLHSSFRSYIVGAEGEERDDATVITWQQWLRLMKHVSPELQEDFLAVLFDIVDVDDDGQITLSEFQHLASLAEVEVEDKEQRHKAKHQGKWCLARLRRTRRRVRHVVFNFWAALFWDILVVANTIILILMALARARSRYLGVYSILQYSFLTVFVIELTLKIFGVGLVKFWRENVFNKVDFIAIVGAVFAEILFVAVLHNQRSAILQGFIFMRMLRLLRTLRLVRQFKVMVTSFVDIVPALLRYMGLALGVYYSFAIVGMELFSGKFIRGKLVGTAYFNNDYWLNNFDNLHTAMVTLFELMVVNNWPINMEAAVAATTVWARFYYLAWYAVSVIVVINVLVAFLLDSFATRQALNESEQTGLEKVWKRLFRRSARRLGYSPERWAITREERVGDLYEAMYHNDLKENPLFEVAGKKSLEFETRRRGASFRSDASFHRRSARKYDSDATSDEEDEPTSDSSSSSSSSDTEAQVVATGDEATATAGETVYGSITTLPDSPQPSAATANGALEAGASPQGAELNGVATAAVPQHIQRRHSGGDGASGGAGGGAGSGAGVGAGIGSANGGVVNGASRRHSPPGLQLGDVARLASARPYSPQPAHVAAVSQVPTEVLLAELRRRSATPA